MCIFMTQKHVCWYAKVSKLYTIKCNEKGTQIQTGVYEPFEKFCVFSLVFVLFVCKHFGIKIKIKKDSIILYGIRFVVFFLIFFFDEIAWSYCFYQTFTWQVRDFREVWKVMVNKYNLINK